jgi:hypothetical protein
LITDIAIMSIAIYDNEWNDFGWFAPGIAVNVFFEIWYIFDPYAEMPYYDKSLTEPLPSLPT